MAEARLIFKNKVVLFDSDDIDRIATRKWSLSGNGYIISNKYIRGSGRKNQKSDSVYLHRFIIGAKEDEYVDHINRNPLDNRKSNLRICTQSQNMANSATPKNNTTGSKGVYWHKAAKKWEAAIHYLNKK